MYIVRCRKNNSQTLLKDANTSFVQILLRRVWRYQRGNQNPYIEEEQTTQWPKDKVLKDKQRSTKHTYKTKDRVTRTPLKTGGVLGRSGRVCSFCSTSGTRRVNLVTNPVISREICSSMSPPNCCCSLYVNRPSKVC
jgi:hypothetical protein